MNDKVRQGIGGIVPFLTIMLCGLLSSLSLPVINDGQGGSLFSVFTAMTPDFAFMAIFFWRMVRPELLSPALVFFVGFLLDALSGAPLGMSSFAYLIAVSLVGRLSRLIVPMSGLYWFGGFAIAALMVSIVSWIISSLWALSFVPVLPVLGGLFWTLLLYPVVGSLFSMLARLSVPVSSSR